MLLQQKLYRACSFKEVESYIKQGYLFPKNYEYISLSESPEIGDLICEPNLHQFIMVFDREKLIEMGALKITYTAKFMEEHPDIFYNLTNNNVVELGFECNNDDYVNFTVGYEDLKEMFEWYSTIKDKTEKTNIGNKITSYLRREFGHEKEWVIKEINGFSKILIDINISCYAENKIDSSAKQELEYLKNLIIQTYL